ncbi:MAG: type II toxin-antitoxin system Phd/YefM family antitoxin [Deltaproteobacteria bacterium]|nr:type II toxin-antitoxin system Phd/YefM family antitoxin [Deltaproteobacteria bacterium]
MKHIGAAQFKQECLAVLDRLSPDGIIITKHGRPVAKLIPLGTDSASTIGCLKGKLKIRGDVLSTGLRWHAQP